MAKRTCWIGLVAAAWLLAVGSADARPGKKKKVDQPDGLVPVTYPVADLVIPINNYSESGREEQATLEDRLIEVICRTVAPASWEGNGGRGTLQYFPLGMAIVVRQTPAVQEEVFALLKALRRLQDTEIAVQVMLVSVADEGLNRLNEAQRPDLTKSKAMLMDADEVRQLLETLQGDQATSVMQAPKITMANGQRACLQVGDHHVCVTDVEMIRDGDRVVVQPKKETLASGLKCILRPVASIDRDMVSLALDASLTAAEELKPARRVSVTIQTKDGQQRVMILGPVMHQVRRLAVSRTLKIPEGHTVVLYAGQMRLNTRADFAEADEQGLMSCLYRWLSNAEYGPENHHFLLVTPRVIVNSEATETVVPASIPVPRANIRH